MAPRANSSILWDYFTKDSVKKKGKCLICGELYSYKSSTGNLKAHLRKKHVDIYQRVASIQTSTHLQAKRHQLPVASIFLSGEELPLPPLHPLPPPPPRVPQPPPLASTPPPAMSDTQPLFSPQSQPVIRPPGGTRRLSPPSTTTTTRRLRIRARRNRGLTPFDRAVRKFVAVEERRLRLEERRERDLHERETERLRLEERRERNLHERENERLQLESERIEAAREQNNLLQQLGVIVQTLLDKLPQQR